MDFTQQQISSIFNEIAKGENGYQLLLQQSLESIMRAERQEFNQEFTDQSNGYRKRSILAHGGKLELRIPRTRHHSFHPIMLALIRDQEEEYSQMAYELYSAGLTTAQVGDLFDKIYGRHYSKSSISNMMGTAREDINAWLNRPLDKRYPIIYIDATYWHTRRAESVSKEAYYAIVGVKEDRTREVLAVVNNPTEGASNWDDVFKSLKKRGVQTINLVVSDGLVGIEDVSVANFPGVKTQLCTVHLSRNIQKKVKPSDKKEIAGELRMVLDPTNNNDNQDAGHKRFIAFIEKWQKKYPSLKSFLGPRYKYYFTYLNYHVEIRRMIYTTNWVERLNRNFKRTLRMRASMPSPESVIFLLGSVASRRKEYDRPIYQFIHETKLFY